MQIPLCMGTLQRVSPEAEPCPAQTGPEVELCPVQTGVTVSVTVEVSGCQKTCKFPSARVLSNVLARRPSLVQHRRARRLSSVQYSAAPKEEEEEVGSRMHERTTEQAERGEVTTTSSFGWCCISPCFFWRRAAGRCCVPFLSLSVALFSQMSSVRYPNVTTSVVAGWEKGQGWARHHGPGRMDWAGGRATQ